MPCDTYSERHCNSKAQFSDVTNRIFGSTSLHIQHISTAETLSLVVGLQSVTIPNVVDQ